MAKRPKVRIIDGPFKGKVLELGAVLDVNGDDTVIAIHPANDGSVIRYYADTVEPVNLEAKHMLLKFQLASLIEAIEEGSGLMMHRTKRARKALEEMEE